MSHAKCFWLPCDSCTHKALYSFRCPELYNVFWCKECVDVIGDHSVETFTSTSPFRNRTRAYLWRRFGKKVYDSKQSF